LNRYLLNEENAKPFNIENMMETIIKDKRIGFKIENIIFNHDIIIVLYINPTVNQIIEAIDMLGGDSNVENLEKSFCCDSGLRSGCLFYITDLQYSYCMNKKINDNRR
jgi:hypothetical protein